MVRPRVRIRFSKQGDLPPDRTSGLDAVPGAALSPRRAGPGSEPGVPPQTAADVPAGLGGRDRGRRRGDGSRIDRNAPTGGLDAAAVAASSAGAGLPVGGSPATRQPQGPAPQRFLPGALAAVAPRRPGRADRPFVGRRFLAMAAPARQRGHRPPRRPRVVDARRRCAPDAPSGWTRSAGPDRATCWPPWTWPISNTKAST